MKKWIAHNNFCRLNKCWLFWDFNENRWLSSKKDLSVYPKILKIKKF